MLASRLGAYTGALQARILEERERDKDAIDQPASGQTYGRQRPVKVADDVMLDRLANEGWVSRKGG